MDQINKKNVLIVDDSDLLQNRLKKSLMDTGLNVSITQALSYREAIDLFMPSFYDTIILDIDLPDGSGVNLLREIKSLNPSTKVIMLTNYDTPEFKRSCMKFGADYFFNKSEMAGLLNVI
jgi:DNA-binding NarL/FixJ family response regulator